MHYKFNDFVNFSYCFFVLRYLHGVDSVFAVMSIANTSNKEAFNSP